MVSLPATASRITKKPNSSSESLWPSTSASISLVTMSSPGFFGPLGGHLHGVHDQFDRGGDRVVGARTPGRRRRPSGWTSRTASCGLPAVRRAARRWPAAAVRRTPVRRSRRNPSAAAVLAICRARSSRSSRSRSTARGVKPREMILRRWVWCGASMLSRTNLPRLDLLAGWSRRGSGAGRSSRRLEKTSLRSEISLTSLCLVTTQKPPSLNPPVPSGCSFHQIGALRRNSASSSTGSRSGLRSGSVKSNRAAGWESACVLLNLVAVSHCYTTPRAPARQVGRSVHLEFVLDSAGPRCNDFRALADASSESETTAKPEGGIGEVCVEARPFPSSGLQHSRR